MGVTRSEDVAGAAVHREELVGQRVDARVRRDEEVVVLELVSDRVLLEEHDLVEVGEAGDGRERVVCATMGKFVGTKSVLGGPASEIKSRNEGLASIAER